MAPQNAQTDAGDDTEEDSVVEVITRYARSISQSLRNAVTHAVDAGKEATDSLAELQSQNENLKRIKTALNESHETVTATQKIVDAYVNSVTWISNSIAWKKPTRLEKAETDTNNDLTKNESTRNWKSILWPITTATQETNVTENNPVAKAMGNLASTANDQLDILIEELKSNRQKTELIANTVQQQNEDLERISDSAVALQDRVNQVNRVLRDKT
ncbi:uncharacterized protein BXIN_1934 [Babesia sp. Xinjiang]|uniref:uncharacterized protein n=1 Tax=Babesia sp. Xinjiang TaxID=462227 RepID=UPI000A25D460|nr:uncharacterized protein BXIN_1934 [Babesia sp. Xinjiang]ORM40274.1 hypothetical protein BXIN_1934 [Babesia sp. Xinjiang]